jgi:hypothetical protein
VLNESPFQLINVRISMNNGKLLSMLKFTPTTKLETGKVIRYLLLSLFLFLSHSHSLIVASVLDAFLSVNSLERANDLSLFRIDRNDTSLRHSISLDRTLQDCSIVNFDTLECTGSQLASKPTYDSMASHLSH